MEKISGHLRKMKSHLADPIQYSLVVGSHELPLNACIGAPLQLHYQGEIACVQCGRKTRKSFQQGHCYPCMQRIYECNNCVIHPERCLVEQRGCPADDWAHSQCAADQVVYLANTSGLKVGITRSTQVPTRWIDQGAMQAVPLFTTCNRYQAGLVEVAFKSYVADKTNWRTMLTQDSVTVDLLAEKERLLLQAQADLAPLLNRYPDEIKPVTKDPVQLAFPVDVYPSKVKSLSLDKTEVVGGVLQAIKGQYLIFDVGVLNVRKFSGYLVEVTVG